MSGLISLLQKFNFISNSLEESDESVLTRLPPHCAFVTPRILMIPFPGEENKSLIHDYLKENYFGKYMIWNISEQSYELSDSQIIEYVYQGFPNPPLQELFNICKSIRSWLETDAENISVIHCQASRARSHLVLSLFLPWSSETYSDCTDALVKITRATGANPSRLLMPSQQRYLHYANTILKGIPYPQTRMRLERIILNGIPRFQNSGPALTPYLQIFKGELMIFSSAQTGQVSSYYESDISVVFEVGVYLQDDVLIRCRHAGPKERETVFRFMFNVSFVDGCVLRLEKRNLDGASEDKRIPNDFFVDLFFESPEEHNDPEATEFWQSFAKKPLEEEKEEEKEITLEDDIEEEKVMESVKKRLEVEAESDEEDDGNLDDYFNKLESQS